jgi:lycopene beta-cyclase
MPRSDQVVPSSNDLVLVGGGLQNGLIALSALHANPALRIVIIEASERLGGNHTWCVHAGDVPDSASEWFERLVVRRWSSYEVRFAGFARTLNASYAVVSSERFANVLGAMQAYCPNFTILTGRSAVDVSAHCVTLDDGERLHGALVVDARGPDPKAFQGRAGYQKFVGLELRTAAPHGVSQPILMDATCTQHGGFRFFYVLPLAVDRLLVEETRFSHSPVLDVSDARAAVLRYAEGLCTIAECVREEQGVLPMPWSGCSKARLGTSPLLAGYRGGYFHPATGYSLPAALRIAELIAAHAQTDHFDRAFLRNERQHRAQAAYAEQLNRLLFCAFAETDMWGVFERFYHLPEPLIARFYALSMSVADRARILLGRPPRGFSVKRALFSGVQP